MPHDDSNLITLPYFLLHLLLHTAISSYFKLKKTYFQVDWSNIERMIFILDTNGYTLQSKPSAKYILCNLKAHKSRIKFCYYGLLKFVWY